MKLAVRLALPLLLLLAVVVPSAGMTEFRGLFVDAFHPGIKTHEQVTQMVSAAKAANFNALIVQVRKRGDVYYNSTIEPKASDIASDYDPLADVIQQSHAAGMQVHALVSVYEVSHESYKVAEAHVTSKHPDWLTTEDRKSTVLSWGKIWLDPGVPEVQDYIVSIVREILTKYSVDGIHLDNLRYPSLEAGLNAISIARFRESYARTDTPRDDDEDWTAWRRDQITKLVRRIGETVRAVRPAAQLSCTAMKADPALSSEFFLQDWDAWMRENLLDFACPMLYYRGDTLGTGADKALASSYQRNVYISIGGWQIPSSVASKHIAEARQAGAKGVAVFSYHYLGPNSPDPGCSKLGDMANSVFAEPATMPALPWRQP